MRSALPIILALSVVFLSGCSTAKYHVVPVGHQGAGIAMTFSQKSAEVAANNWGKALSVLTAGAALWKIGDNSGWWTSGSSTEALEQVPVDRGPSAYIHLENVNAPVTINIAGRDYIVGAE